MCGKVAHGVHHLVFGNDRENADYDGLYVPVCDSCHILGHLDDNMGYGYGKESRIHDNPMAETMSKMMGQLMWELSQVADEEQREELKTKFRKRYGKNYL